jgi:uncharacterized membrane protein YqjE
MRAPVEETQVSNGHRSGDLMSDVIHDAQRLVSLEIALAKQELKELATAYAITVGLAAGGGLLLLLALLVALPVFVVESVQWRWQAALVWVAAYAIIGIAMLLTARARFQVRPPKRTLDSLKENKEWALRRVKSKNR